MYTIVRTVEERTLRGKADSFLRSSKNCVSPPPPVHPVVTEVCFGTGVQNCALGDGGVRMGLGCYILDAERTRSPSLRCREMLYSDWAGLVKSVCSASRYNGFAVRRSRSLLSQALSRGPSVTRTAPSTQDCGAPRADSLQLTVLSPVTGLHHPSLSGMSGCRTRKRGSEVLTYRMHHDDPQRRSTRVQRVVVYVRVNRGTDMNAYRTRWESKR